MIPHYFSYVISFSDGKGFKIEVHVARDTTVHDILKKMYGGQGGHKMILIFIYLCISSVSLLEGSLSGVEALRHLRLDLQSRKKASVQSLFNKLSSF